MFASPYKQNRRRATLGRRWLGALTLAAMATGAMAQQVPDTRWWPVVPEPRHAPGSGPQLCLDEAHHNFHRLEGRFTAFARLVRADGYRLRGLSESLSTRAFAGCDILIIANAQASDIDWDHLPTPSPSAFTTEEVGAVKTWVHSGGALLLIADHMPFPAAASALASAFEYHFNDGFAVDDFETEAQGHESFAKPTLFRREDGSLAKHVVVDGEKPPYRVTQVRTFTGQAFTAPNHAQPLLVLPDRFVSLMPDKAWRFNSATKKIPVGGWLQGALSQEGKGRLAVFGEAGMFTAQVQHSAGKSVPMGLNAPLAEGNAQFVLNVLGWLASR